MSLGTANIAGLASPRQQSEMKCILAGMWPPLKPLPIFKYETVAYRATIDFDKLRGEWVCRKISFPSNKVQELRGGLREITMALPHGEAELSIEGVEQQQQEQEQEQDTNRRLQAIHDWRQNSESGERYFELREYLSGSQRAEIDDSLRLSLTARQLQFNSKNVAFVFNALSTAGGRFAALIEFAKRNKAKLGTVSMETGGAAPEAERAIDQDNPSLRTSFPELGPVHTHDIPVVRDQAEELCADAEEVPGVSVKNLFLEQDPPSLAERTARPGSQPFEIETSEPVDADSVSLVEQPNQEGRHTPALKDFAAGARMDKLSRDRTEDSSSRLSALEISAFQVAAFAFLFLFAVTLLTVGLTMGHGPLGRRLLETSKSMLTFDTKLPTLPGQTHESTSPASPMASSNEPAGTNKFDATTPSENKSKENPGGSRFLAEVPSTDSDSSRTIKSTASVNPKVYSEQSGASGRVVRNVLPPAISKAAPSREAVGSTSSAPRSPAPNRSTGTIGAVPHLARPSTILVNVPVPGSQAFRVSFPEKAIAATSSFAMTSQLSVLISPRPRPPVADKPARLEAGELVSFVWPRYPRTGDRNGAAEIIRVRVTIGQLGQVREVKFLSGSPSLLPATTRAIRQWRYRATLLDERPVQAQQDVTIEFRRTKYSAQASTQHPAHN